MEAPHTDPPENAWVCMVSRLKTEDVTLKIKDGLLKD